MTYYGTLRVWAALLMLLGPPAMMAAGAGTLIWAIEVDGFWRTIGVLLFGGPVSLLLAVLPVALAQALRALADVAQMQSAR
jgi:hypothetical protein